MRPQAEQTRDRWQERDGGNQRRGVEIRAAALRAVRAFFDRHDFLEVDTPIRIAAPAMEEHIDAQPSGGAYLRTSPELHMKRMLADGYERIYQVGACFRAGESGPLHRTEYTMLEWYRAGASYMDMLLDTKALLVFVARMVTGGDSLSVRGRPLPLLPVWDCMTVSEAFLEFAGWDPAQAFDADRFDVDLVSAVEPALAARDHPVVLSDFPAPRAALARLKPGHPAVAERWELYIGDIELANAYSELTDAAEQRKRFDDSALQRRAAGRGVYPLDDLFLDMLAGKGLPPCAGVALGMDRLVMLLAGAAGVDEVNAFPAIP